MNANTNNPTNITLTPAEYMRMLETNMEQSAEIVRLRKSLQEEYNYAENLLKECDRLTNECKRLEAELDDLKKARAEVQGSTEE